MKLYKADLHMHTVLSPCGDLEMSPRNIVDAAITKGLDIIGITDHNSTRNARVVREVASGEGLFVLTGVEVTTREEIHCLCFFEHDEELDEFQAWIEEKITRVPNSPDKFGYQVVVDENENILDEVEYLLVMALNSTIDEVEVRVHELNGLFIPAHVDRPVNGILSQLGFFPEGIVYDAIEIYSHGNIEMTGQLPAPIARLPVIRSSDSHYLLQIGQIATGFLIETPSFIEIRMALMGLGGRSVVKL
jgi:PHP family Zn ribbon phosphoesterase